MHVVLQIPKINPGPFEQMPSPLFNFQVLFSIEHLLGMLLVTFWFNSIVNNIVFVNMYTQNHYILVCWPPPITKVFAHKLTRCCPLSPLTMSMLNINTIAADFLKYMFSKAAVLPESRGSCCDCQSLTY